MGQIIKRIKKVYLEIMSSHKVFIPYEDKITYFENQYIQYLDGRFVNANLFRINFLNLNSFEMNEIITKHLKKSSSKQRKLIKLIESHSDIIDKEIAETRDLINRLSKELNFVRFLLFLIELKQQYEDKLNCQFTLNICNKVITETIRLIDYKILKYRDIVVNELEDNNIKFYHFTTEQIVGAYVVLDEKQADIFFEKTLFQDSFHKGYAFELLFNEYLIGKNEKFLPNIRITDKNVIEIRKVNIERQKFKPISKKSTFNLFKQEHLLKSNSIKNQRLFTEQLYRLLKKIDNSYSSEDIEIFYESITQEGLSKYRHEYYTEIQIKFNRTFSDLNNRKLFYCFLFLTKLNYHNINDLFLTFLDYFYKETQFGLANFKKLLYDKGELTISKYLDEFKTELTDILPTECKTYFK